LNCEKAPASDKSPFVESLCDKNTTFLGGVLFWCLNEHENTRRNTASREGEYFGG